MNELVDDMNKKFGEAIEESVEYLPTLAFVGRCVRCKVAKCRRFEIIKTFRQGLDGLLMKCVDFDEVDA